MPLNTKDNLFKDKQNEIFEKILQKINITRENNQINRTELDTPEIKNFISSMMDDITKYYETSNWKSIYRESNKEFNILKNIMKHHGIEIYKFEKKKMENGVSVRNRLYIFNFN